jgi:hypothetical protein
MQHGTPLGSRLDLTGELVAFLLAPGNTLFLQCWASPNRSTVNNSEIERLCLCNFVVLEPGLIQGVHFLERKSLTKIIIEML